eukprot:Hpha_TRINITY_DN16370_c1_g1::TRINITY_DN16370_c1_g1_i1::g.62417::m.62417
MREEVGKGSMRVNGSGSSERLVELAPLTHHRPPVNRLSARPAAAADAAGITKGLHRPPGASSSRDVRGGEGVLWDAEAVAQRLATIRSQEVPAFATAPLRPPHPLVVGRQGLEPSDPHRPPSPGASCAAAEQQAAAEWQPPSANLASAFGSRYDISAALRPPGLPWGCLPACPHTASATLCFSCQRQADAQRLNRQIMRNAVAEPAPAPLVREVSKQRRDTAPRVTTREVEALLAATLGEHPAAAACPLGTGVSLPEANPRLELTVLRNARGVVFPPARAVVQ